MDSLVVSLSRKMVSFFFSYLFTLFGFMRHYFSRLKMKYIAQKGNSNYVLIQLGGNQQTDNSVIDEGKDDEFGEEKESESFLEFRFPTYEEFVRNNGELVNVEGVHDMKDEQVLVENSSEKVVGIKDEEEKNSIASYGADMLHSKEIIRPQSCSEINLVNESEHVGVGKEENSTKISFKEVLQWSSVNNIVGGGKAESSKESVESEGLGSQLVSDSGFVNKFVHVGNVNVEDRTKITEVDVSQKSPINDFFACVGKYSEEMEVENEVKESKVKSLMNENLLFSDDEESLVSDSDSDSISSSSKSSFRSSLIDSFSDGFLSDIDFDRVFEVDNSKEFDELEVKSDNEPSAEDIELQNLSKGYEAEDFEDEDEEILKELKNLEESNLESGNVTLEQDNGVNVDTKEHAEKPNSGEQLSSDSDEQNELERHEQNELERQWEHQDLLEQLKMEIRKVRAIGLPTILEESELPRIAEDLKPWKIEEKFQHEDTLDELHKFHKSYRERMRKLDILNYQKMYAIGFLRLKDPLQSFTKHKISTPSLAAIVSLGCWPRKPNSEPETQQPVMNKFSRELESDLEMVYVGQTCLSWEFLHWEYEKALELWNSDPHGVRHYNEAAEKFQQFQVLLTRFIEDEPFQGPRVQHYVKTRCVLRNLLQVPLIRDDNTRDKKKRRIIVSSKDAITSVKLVEMIEESIRVFWQFIRADKDTSNTVLLMFGRGYIPGPELQSPADAELLAQIQTCLYKKEKKVKLSRSENCILRKFGAHLEDSSDNTLCFFSQVNLRLVQRVLNMSRISTEQLIWCGDKLSKINFSGRKLLVEPSVLLFPCS